MDGLFRLALKQNIRQSSNVFSTKTSSTSIIRRRSFASGYDKRDYGPSYPYSFGSYYLSSIPGIMLVLVISGFVWSQLDEVYRYRSNDVYETSRERMKRAQIRGQAQANAIAREGIPHQTHHPIQTSIPKDSKSKH